MKKYTCPMCKGKGWIKVKTNMRNVVSIDTKQKAFLLRKEGYTFREIAKKLGFNNPESANCAIKSYIKYKYG